MVYSLCIFFYKRLRNPNARMTFDFNEFFDHYDFRDNASKFQIVLSAIFWIIGLAALIFVTLWIVPIWIIEGINWLKEFLSTHPF